MPEHVRMDGEGECRAFASPLNHSTNAHTAERLKQRHIVDPKESKLDRENGGAKQQEELDLGAIGSGAFSKYRQQQLPP